MKKNDPRREAATGTFGVVSAAVLVAFVGLYAWVQIHGLPAAPVLETDSASYIAFAPIRSAGYPLFLKLVGVDAVPIVQTLLYAVALAFLSLETSRTTGSLVLAVGLLVVLMINPELNKYHAIVMTESPFMSVEVAFLAALVRFARIRGWRSAAGAASWAGLAAAIRPTGYAFGPALLLMALMCRRRLSATRTAVLLAAIVPTLAIVAGERAIAVTVHGAAGSQLARHVFAKAALLDAPPPAAPEQNPIRRTLAAALDEDYAPIRTLLRKAPTAEMRRLLSANYEVCIEWDCVSALRGRIGMAPGPLDALALAVGLQRIAGDPWGYAALVGTNYQSLWLLYGQSHPELAPAFAAFIAAQRPLPFEALVPDLLRDRPASRVAAIARPAVAAIGWLTGLLALLGLGAAVRGRTRRAAAVAFASALTVHGSFLLTAIVGVGIPRYTVALWPAMATALVFAGWWVFVALVRVRHLPVSAALR